MRKIITILRFACRSILAQSLKKYFPLVILSFSFTISYAQSFNSESLFNVIKTSKNDSLQIDAALTIIFRNQRADADTLMYYSKKLLDYGQRYKLPHIEAIGFTVVGFSFYRLLDMPKLQEYILKAAAVEEKYPDSAVLAIIVNCMSFYQPTTDLQIAYLRRALRLYTACRKPDAVYIAFYDNLAVNFMDKNQLDSALLYAQKAYEYASDIHDTYFDLSTASLLGDVHLALQHYDIALGFYKQALAISQKTKLAVDLKTAYSAMTNYFDAINQKDSGLVYASKIIDIAGNGEYDARVAAAGWLYKYYQQKNKADSTVKYMEIYIDGQDSVNNTEKNLQVQKTNFEEDLKQREIEAAKEAAADVRSHNIQLAVLAICILTSIIIFLLLSRSFIVSHKMIEVLGVIVLLVVFEFINLLLHPFLEGITHDSPVLMLLALVILATVIVPIHHRLEHWVNHKLVEKNRAVHLAKARKVIAELENTDEPQITGSNE